VFLYSFIVCAFFKNRLNQLRVLELRENRLQALPNSLSALMYLQRLDVGTNDFIQLVHSCQLLTFALIEYMLQLISLAWLALI
jgi:hypothetical protein